MSGTCEIYHVYINMTKEKKTSCFNHFRTKRGWIKIIATMCNELTISLDQICNHSQLLWSFKMVIKTDSLIWEGVELQSHYNVLAITA